MANVNTPPPDRAAETVQLVADLLNRCGHPDLADVEITVSHPPTVKVAHRDGSRNFLKVPHVGPAARPAPERPSWPGYPASDKGAW